MIVALVCLAQIVGLIYFIAARGRPLERYFVAFLIGLGDVFTAGWYSAKGNWWAVMLNVVVGALFIVGSFYGAAQLSHKEKQ